LPKEKVEEKREAHKTFCSYPAGTDPKMKTSHRQTREERTVKECAPLPEKDPLSVKEGRGATEKSWRMDFTTIVSPKDPLPIKRLTKEQGVGRTPFLQKGEGNYLPRTNKPAVLKTTEKRERTVYYKKSHKILTQEEYFRGKRT